MAHSSELSIISPRNIYRNRFYVLRTVQVATTRKYVVGDPHLVDGDVYLYSELPERLECDQVLDFDVGVRVSTLGGEVPLTLVAALPGGVGGHANFVAHSGGATDLIARIATVAPGGLPAGTHLAFKLFYTVDQFIVEYKDPSMRLLKE